MGAGAAASGAALPRLLYVEDDASVAEMVLEVLREHYEVDHAGDIAAARRQLATHRYAVVVVDRRLPDGDGLAIVASLRAARLTTPVLLLTALDAVDDRVAGLDAGANDYLAKPFDLEELLARLRALRRGFAADAARRDLGSWTFVAEPAALYGPDGRRVPLTATETRLLALLTESPDHVFTREEILGSVLGGGRSLASVDALVHYLRRKSDPGVVDTVRGRGYRAGAP
ncbi:response regulator transcription factor [Agrococcus carbonis]|uniref:DNA-binding response regulator, OmpR family, contains REC and winged-helix (WHTH) domain n=1 Tax=Agrococcus carbonis TaxID=684552 RepID=A0A1H1T3V2_9MICO|nr:response regulator transcription factor [Agrococcus carbonis]SDS54858.1 DNA-binding response regulator, OmpR family, contains REC and winged-helix (wHTH) domain [Agrococcus carbonis]